MEQLDRLRTWRHAELIAQGSDTETILTAHKLLLMLQGEATHEKPVYRLAALSLIHI